MQEGSELVLTDTRRRDEQHIAFCYILEGAIMKIFYCEKFMFIHRFHVPAFS